MKTKKKTKTPQRPTLAATVAGEDLACGDYVAILSELVDVPSYLWETSGASLSPHEMVRLKLVPSEAGLPLKVIAICLPFVYAKSPQEVVTVDIRHMQLVRLDPKNAQMIWKQLRARAKRRE